MALLDTDPVDLFLDPATDDLAVGRDLAFISGLEGVAQLIKIRVNLFAGEWFLDLEEGIEYYQKILGHKYSEDVVRAEFRDEILKIPGVLSVVKLESTFNRSSRLLTISWEVNTIFGNTTGEVPLSL